MSEFSSNQTAAPSETSASIPPPNVWPALRARNAPALIAFLVEAFGFESVVVHGDGDVVHHAELSWPLGGGIMLGSVREPADGKSMATGVASCYIVTDDPDALCARARAAGATIVRELTDTDYGSREFGALDPEGNTWSFGTYRGEPRRS
jgi:uncharacterized glyoxalase superfamily protein PhnB